METDVISRLSFDEELAGKIFEIQPNWIAELTILLRANTKDERLEQAISRYNPLVKELENKPLILTDPQRRRKTRPQPKPLFTTIRPLVWNSVFAAALKEIQTRFRFSFHGEKDPKTGQRRAPKQPITQKYTTGLVGTANSEKDAYEQLSLVFNSNPSFSEFIEYKLIYSKTSVFGFKITWKAFPEHLASKPTKELTLAEVVELTTSGEKRLKAVEALRYMIRTMFLYTSIPSRTLPTEQEILHNFAKEYLSIIEKGTQNPGVFSYNYRRHLATNITWLSIEAKYFDWSDSRVFARHELDLGDTYAYVTWYTFLKDEKKNLEEKLRNIK